MLKRSAAVAAASIIGAVLLMAGCTAPLSVRPSVPVQAPKVSGPAFPSGDPRLTPTSDPSAIDSATALARVESAISTGALASVKSIAVGEYRFASDTVASSVVPSGALVWVVTLNGMVIRDRGVLALPAGASAPAAPVHHQANFFVDANTGKLLMLIPGK